MVNGYMNHKIMDTVSTTHNFIHGKPTKGQQNSLDVYSPFNGSVISKVILSKPYDLDEAVASAKSAYPNWSKKTLKQRVQVLFNFRQVPVPREPFSFGDWNESNFGANDITGKSAIGFWTKLKKRTTKWNPEDWKDWTS